MNPLTLIKIQKPPNKLSVYKIRNDDENLWVELWLLREAQVPKEIDTVDEMGVGLSASSFHKPLIMSSRAATQSITMRQVAFFVKKWGRIKTARGPFLRLPFSPKGIVESLLSTKYSMSLWLYNSPFALVQSWNASRCLALGYSKSLLCW